MTNYNKLVKIINEIDFLISERVNDSDDRFKEWKIKAEFFLKDTFGLDSLEYKKFKKILFEPYISTLKTEKNEFTTSCCNGLKESKTLFQTLLDRIEDDEEIIKMINMQKNNKIFIVHGHDGELKQSVARFLEKIELEPVIIAEQPMQGKTIIEKIERYSNVSGAICLFTKDDLAKKKDVDSYEYHARENVIFEAGFLIAKLGRQRVIFLVDQEVKLPSDILGIGYVDTKDWKLPVLNELREMGFEVDANKVIES